MTIMTNNLREENIVIIVIIVTGSAALVASGHFGHLQILILCNAANLSVFQFQVVKLTT